MILTLSRPGCRQSPQIARYPLLAPHRPAQSPCMPGRCLPRLPCAQRLDLIGICGANKPEQCSLHPFLRPLMGNPQPLNPGHRSVAPPELCRFGHLCPFVPRLLHPFFGPSRRRCGIRFGPQISCGTVPAAGKLHPRKEGCGRRASFADVRSRAHLVCRRTPREPSMASRGLSAPEQASRRNLAALPQGIACSVRWRAARPFSLGRAVPAELLSLTALLEPGSQAATRGPAANDRTRPALGTRRRSKRAAPRPPDARSIGEAVACDEVKVFDSHEAWRRCWRVRARVGLARASKCHPSETFLCHMAYDGGWSSRFPLSVAPEQPNRLHGRGRSCDTAALYHVRLGCLPRDVPSSRSREVSPVSPAVGLHCLDGRCSRQEPVL